MYLTHKKKYVVARCTCFPERKIFIGSYSKCVCVIPLKDKKGITISNAFQKTSNKSNRNQMTHG